jgi:hypothetical protein
MVTVLTGERPRSALRSVAWVVLVLTLVVCLVRAGVDSAPDTLFDDWLNDLVLWLAFALCLDGAFRHERGRSAFLCISAGLACWAVGDTIASIRFGDSAGPLTSLSDVLWLAWYPLMLVALVLLVRDLVPEFQVHRWIDGLAVMLLVAVPCVALFLEPAAARSSASFLDDSVAFAYVLGDAILIGAALGAYALMAWRIDRMWLALGVGLIAMAVADSIFSVNALSHSSQHGGYEVAWAAGAALLAFAAAQPRPLRLDVRPPTGWAAIALPLLAQMLALGIQLYAIFDELPTSERILSAAVLLIAIAQIVMTRPRAPSEGPEGDR